MLLGFCILGGGTVGMDCCVTLGAGASNVGREGMSGGCCAGFVMALLGICATWMNALVVVDPYWRDGMLLALSCKIVKMSEAAWRR
jgi:hypothetical protein